MEELLSQVQKKLDYLNNLKSYEGKCIPPILKEILNIKLGRTSIASRSRFVILFFFNLSDCANCLTSEIINWNKFNISYDQKICQVIGVTDTVGYRNLEYISKSLNIRFSLVHMPEMKNNLLNYGITSTPMVVFGDLMINKIIYAQFTNVYNVSNDEFTKKLQMVLDTCQE